MVTIQDIDLIKQFVDKYNSAQASIDAHDVDTAKKKYKELLKIYNAIHASKLEKEHKELAYDQVMRVYKGVHSIKISKPFLPHIPKSALLAGIVLLISIVIFIKPEIIGFAFEESVLNQAPVWNSADTVFTVRAPETRLNLNNYFTDPDKDLLTFLATSTKGINVEVSGPWLIMTPEPGAYGTEQITVIASDGMETAKRQIILNIQSHGVIA